MQNDIEFAAHLQILKGDAHIMSRTNASSFDLYRQAAYAKLRQQLAIRLVLCVQQEAAQLRSRAEQLSDQLNAVSRQHRQVTQHKCQARRSCVLERTNVQQP